MPDTLEKPANDTSDSTDKTAVSIAEAPGINLDNPLEINAEVDQQDPDVPVGPKPEKLYKHTHEDGSEVSATRSQAEKLCPVLGKMSVEKREATFNNTEARQRAIAARRAKRVAEEQKTQQGKKESKENKHREVSTQQNSANHLATLPTVRVNVAPVEAETNSATIHDSPQQDVEAMLTEKVVADPNDIRQFVAANVIAEPVMDRAHEHEEDKPDDSTEKMPERQEPNNSAENVAPGRVVKLEAEEQVASTVDRPPDTSGARNHTAAERPPVARQSPQLVTPAEKSLAAEPSTDLEVGLSIAAALPIAKRVDADKPNETGDEILHVDFSKNEAKTDELAAPEDAVTDPERITDEGARLLSEQDEGVTKDLIAAAYAELDLAWLLAAEASDKDAIDLETTENDIAPTLVLGEMLDGLQMEAPDHETPATAESKQPESYILDAEAGEVPTLAEQIFTIFERQIILLGNPEKQAVAYITLETASELIFQVQALGVDESGQAEVLTEKLQEVCAQLLEQFHIDYDEAALKVLVIRLIQTKPEPEKPPAESIESIWYEPMREIAAGNPIGLFGSLFQLPLEVSLPGQYKLGQIAVATH